MTQFSPDAAQRAAEATRWVERRTQNPPVRRARWFRTPGGGGRREVMFELAYPLDSEDTSVMAYPRPWDSAQSLYVTDYDAETFPVYDYIYRFRGRGRDDLESPDSNGSQGFAVLRNRRFEIQYLEPHALWITCNVDGDYTGGDITVKNMVVTKPIKRALRMEAQEVVFKLHDWGDLDDNAVLQASWNDPMFRWDGVQVDCAASA
jgi:hypothetical protein